MITLENYESYLFLYQEGELDSSTCLEIERFLQQHPDIREEMETYYDPSLVVTAESPVRQQQRSSHLWRWTAAACVALALGWGAHLVLSSEPREGTTVAQVATPDLQMSTQDIETANTTIVETSPAAATAPAASQSDERRLASPATPVLQAEASPEPRPLAANRPPATEEPIAAQPLPRPAVVESQLLAEVNEIIMVDNLAEEIAAEEPVPQPSVLLQLARNIRKNLDGTKQNIQEFLHGLTASQREEVLADACLTTEQ